MKSLSRSFKGVQIALSFILCLTLMRICSARDIKDVSPQLKAITKIATDTIKLIDEGATEGDNELMRLQSTSNTFQLYVQDAAHYFHESVNQITDNKLKEQLVPLSWNIPKVAYGMAKAKNGDAPTIKKNLKNVLNGYLNLIPRAEEAINAASQQNAGTFAVNLNQHSYDIALFMYVTLYVDIRFRKESRQIVGENVAQNVAVLHKLLDDVGDKSVEFSAFAQLLPEFCDKIVHQIERWAYLSRPENSTKNVITGVYNSLGELVNQFRIKARSKNSTTPIQVTVKEFFVNAAPEILKLKEAATTLSQQDQEIYKDVLLEILSVVSTIRSELEILAGQHN